jgi:sulfofructose kinase
MKHEAEWISAPICSSVIKIMPFGDSPQVVGLGQCSLDILGKLNRYPELDQKAELTSLLLQGGGPVATALVTLARLGVATAMVGATGDDEIGRQIRQGLNEEKIDCTHLLIQPGTSSQVAFIAVDACGRRNVFWHRGSAAPKIPQPLQLFLPDTVRILHLDGLHPDVAVAAAKLARSRQVTTILDGGTLRPGMEQLLPLIDHLVVSEKFARQFSPHPDPDVILRSLAVFGAQAVTITFGNSGSRSIDSDGRIICQAAYEMNAVDTTGCGDVFHGGYIYGLLQDWPLSRTLDFAAACAALKTRAVGGRTAIPVLREVMNFLQQQVAR